MEEMVASALYGESVECYLEVFPMRSALASVHVQPTDISFASAGRSPLQSAPTRTAATEVSRTER
jgi:hypothetical protein